MSFMRLPKAAAYCALAMLACAGCTTQHFIVPAPIVRQYHDPLPVSAGFLMGRSLRDQWYSKKEARTRIDVPIGKVVLDFAEANLSEAFKLPDIADRPETRPYPRRDFYVIRYYDRRSEEGLLIKLNEIEFKIEGTAAYARLNFTLEDAEGNELFTKDYYGKGTPDEGQGILQKTIYAESNIELSTAAALTMIYQDLLQDIRDQLQQ
jgi:hypothetical protein